MHHFPHYLLEREIIFNSKVKFMLEVHLPMKRISDNFNMARLYEKHSSKKYSKCNIYKIQKCLLLCKIQQRDENFLNGLNFVCKNVFKTF